MALRSRLLVLMTSEGTNGRHKDLADLDAYHRKKWTNLITGATIHTESS